LILQEREAAIPGAAVDVIHHVVEVPQAAPPPRGGAVELMVPAGAVLARRRADDGGAAGAAGEEAGGGSAGGHRAELEQQVVHVLLQHPQVLLLLLLLLLHWNTRRCLPGADVVMIGLFLLLLVLILPLQQQQLALHLASLLEEPRPGALDVLGRLGLLEVRPPVVLDLVVRPPRQAARDRRPSVVRASSCVRHKEIKPSLTG
jgi:hypothetical protein